MVMVTWEKETKEFPNSKYVVGEDITIPDYVLGNYKDIVKFSDLFKNIYQAGAYFFDGFKLPYNIVESFEAAINKVVPIKIDSSNFTSTPYKRLPGHLKSLKERTARVYIVADTFKERGIELKANLKELEEQSFYEYKVPKEVVNPRALFKATFNKSSNSFPEDIVEEAFKAIYSEEVEINDKVAEISIAYASKKKYELREDIEEIASKIIPFINEYSNPMLFESDLKRALTDVFVETRKSEQVITDSVEVASTTTEPLFDFSRFTPSVLMSEDRVPFTPTQQTGVIQSTINNLFKFHSGKDYKISSYFFTNPLPLLENESGPKVVMMTSEYLRSYLPLSDDSVFLSNAEKILALVNADMVEADNQSEKFFLSTVAKYQVQYSYKEGNETSEILFSSRDGKVPNYRLALDLVIVLMSSTNRVKLPTSVRMKVKITSFIVIKVAKFLKSLSNEEIDELRKDVTNKSIQLYEPLMKFIFKSEYQPGSEDQLLLELLHGQSKQ